MRNSHLAPSLGQSLLGLALCAGGVQGVLTSWSSAWELAAAAATAALIGLGLIVHAEMKDRPDRFLRKARKSLSFPEQWALKHDKRLPQGGVIALAVIRPDGLRFVVDIQSHAQCDWNDSLDEGEPLLIGPRGRKFKTDPAGPLLHAAETCGAVAVLWLPQAQVTRNLRQDGSNLIVVMGPARELLNALRSAEVAPSSLQAPADKPIEAHASREVARARAQSAQTASQRGGPARLAARTEAGNLG